ncbi:MAG: PTS ascorbate transporter subunit IIC [Malacoplasma sp.]|nr:PTS ascorbate transporter subunit IIC [Malacoplasma sp.]
MNNDASPNKDEQKFVDRSIGGFFKRHWKPIVVILSIIVVFVIGYLIVAGTGAPSFTKNANLTYGAVAGNFAQPLDALSWYFNVVLIDNFLGVPAILLGVLSFVGYLVLKRGFVDSFIGAIKTAIGVLLLNIGSTFLSGVVSPIFTGIKSVFGLQVVSLDPYIGWSSGLTFLQSFSNNNYVSWVSYALLIGFAFNLVMVGLRRWTNCHAVMTTGHIMFQQSAVVVPFVYLLFFSTAPLLNGGSDASASATAATVVFSGIFLGTYWSVGTTSTIKPTNIITENANFAIGHQQVLGISLAYRLGKFFSFTKKGQEIVSAENRKMSKRFRIFEDNIFVQSLLILILFLILAIILQAAGQPGNKFTDVVAGASTYWAVSALGTFWVVQIFMGALLVVASILALSAGVRMFVTELQQAFQGISEKVIPGSVVAVDIAAVYGFSPNAVTYGFLSGVIGQFIAVGITLGLSQIPGSPNVVVVPLFITLFFNSGAIGVYANVKGGWKAAIVLPAIFGFIEIIIISFALGQVQNAFTNAMNNGAVIASAISPINTGYNGMVDWNLFFGFPLIFAAMSPIAAYIILPIEVVALLVMVQFVDTNMPNHQPTKFSQKMMQHFKKNKAISVNQ